MKFILPLFLSLASVSDAFLAESVFNLDPPTFVQTDAQTVQVLFDHGAGPDSGLTYELITEGACYAGGNFPNPLVSNAGITIPSSGSGAKTYALQSGSSTVYETSYTFEVNLGGALVVTGDETDMASIVLCVTHYFEDSGSSTIPNFQQTELTLKYDLDAEQITSLTFDTAATDPNKVENLGVQTIGAEASSCIASIPLNQGEIACVKICPDASSDVGDDFKVTQVLDGKVTLSSTSPAVTQDLTTNTGAVVSGSANIVQVNTDGTDGDCQKIEFYLDNEFFAVFQALNGQNAATQYVQVQLTGSALLADKDRRLGSSSRGLQTSVKESEFDMDMTLVRSEGTSGSVTVSVTRFALVGAAGAALLI